MSEPQIEEAVVAKILTRRDAGRKKYGTTMERTDLSTLDWLRHAQEEALDFAIYLERLIRDAENDAAFIRAGHKPANKACNHAGYEFAKHGRHCPLCGTCMVDPGD